MLVICKKSRCVPLEGVQSGLPKLAAEPVAAYVWDWRDRLCRTHPFLDVPSVRAKVLLASSRLSMALSYAVKIYSIFA